MNSLKLALAFLSLILANNVAAQITKANPIGEKTQITKTVPPVEPSDSQHIIGKEDLLAVQVWREPELTRMVSVCPDGKISLPLVGED